MLYWDLLHTLRIGLDNLEDDIFRPTDNKKPLFRQLYYHAKTEYKSHAAVLIAIQSHRIFA